MPKELVRIGVTWQKRQIQDARISFFPKMPWSARESVIPMVESS